MEGFLVVTFACVVIANPARINHVHSVPCRQIDNGAFHCVSLRTNVLHLLNEDLWKDIVGVRMQSLQQTRDVQGSSYENMWPLLVLLHSPIVCMFLPCCGIAHAARLAILLCGSLHRSTKSHPGRAPNVKCGRIWWQLPEAMFISCKSFRIRVCTEV